MSQEMLYLIAGKLLFYANGVIMRNHDFCSLGSGSSLMK